MKIDATAADAHNEFPSWVQPIKEGRGLTKGTVPAFGDEATQTRNPGVNAAIFVRRGTCSEDRGLPAPPLAALKAAAKTQRSPASSPDQAGGRRSGRREVAIGVLGW